MDYQKRCRYQPVRLDRCRLFAVVRVRFLPELPVQVKVVPVQLRALYCFPKTVHRLQERFSLRHLAVTVPAAHFASGYANAFLMTLPARFHHKGLIAAATDGQAAVALWQGGRCG